MIACILLASGFGRRFGSNKLLYEVHGISMYQHALHMLQALSQQTIDGQHIQIIVVSQYACIEQHAQELGMRAVHNADAAEGIAASVRHGVQAARQAGNTQRQNTGLGCVKRPAGQSNAVFRRLA